MNNILGQAVLFYIRFFLLFPFFFFKSGHITEQMLPKDPEGLPVKHNNLLRCSSYPENCRGSKDGYMLFTLREGGEGLGTPVFVSDSKYGQM